MHRRVYNCAQCGWDLCISAVILRVLFQGALHSRGEGPGHSFYPHKHVSVYTGRGIIISGVQDPEWVQEESEPWFHADGEPGEATKQQMGNVGFLW